jgi:hypothetical protein
LPPTIKPIETRYKGYRFRSRLEARWAVFFDAMHIEWEYEKEGYNLGELGCYLPDFWLPQVNMWAEVKAKEFTPDEYKKIVALNKGTHHPVLMLVGAPDFLTYDATDGYDYLFGEGHSYHLTENRFYCSTEFQGMPKNKMREDVKSTYGDILEDAINAALSARFEFGESG